MFDNPYSIVKIIGILSGIAFLIFRFQVISEMFSGFRKWKNDKNDRELNSKVGDYLSKHQSSELNDDNEDFKQNFVNPISLHVLRIVKSDIKYSIYFSNKGGNGSKLDIHSSDVEEITIEPNNIINNGSSGCITLKVKNKAKTEINFELEYSDNRMNRNTKKYLFSILDDKVGEIY